MKLADLRDSFPQRLQDDLDALWRAYRAENSGDLLSFVSQLQERGVLTNEEMRDILLSGPVTLNAAQVTRSRLAHKDRPRHRKFSVLGAGAMGEVLVALDEHTNRVIALKRTTSGVVASEEAIERFHAEAQITAQLDHPCIVPVHSLELDQEGMMAYSMKLVRGQTLQEYIDETRAFLEKGQPPDDDHSLAHRLDLFLDVCAAMDYAHTRSVIHRDLKPANIMVGAFHQVLVMDWGIAKVIGTGDRTPSGEADGDAPSGQTQLGVALGTPPYMSPEQAQGLNQDLDGRSDQYALGLILYELLTLKRAVQGKTAYASLALAASAEKDPMVPFHPLEPIPRELRAIVDKATAERREDRYPTVEDLADDVRRYLRNQAVLAAPDTTLQAAQRWLSNHRQAATLAIMGLMVLTLGVGMIGIVSSLAIQAAARHEAELREARMGELSAEVTRSAHALDERLTDFQTLLEGVAFSTETALRLQAPDVPVYLVEDFHEGRGPADLQPSSFYSGPISLHAVDAVLATGVEHTAALDTQLQRLSGLAPQFHSAFRRSYPQEAPTSWESLGLLRGFPLMWAYVATEDGAMVGYPAMGEYPDPYDPREMAWYKGGWMNQDVTWLALEADESGMGLLLTAARGIFDTDGTPRGVAAVDVGFTYLIDQFLETPAIRGDVESFLVTHDGMTVVRSSQRDVALRTQEYTQEPFPWPEALTQTERSSGVWVYPAEDRIFVWTRLTAIDWTFVTVGKASEQL
ncbi:MAG: protein kinase [Deltaproteobacteria bacterium]|nr:protein kinase [Deltaproteobacteria bacterium]